MNLKNIGIQIASRELFAEGKKITVIIGMPKKFKDGDDYYCPYQICGIGSDKVRYSGGVDAIQALQLTLNMIGSDLYASKEAKVLFWSGSDEEGNFGFPVPKSVY